MKYVGIQTQIRRNNTRSFFLLTGFPIVLFGLVYLFFAILNQFSEEPQPIDVVNEQVVAIAPFILLGVAIWFTIAWFSHSSIINKATGAKPLERSANKRIYNLLENLCISVGMKMPKLYIIQDDSLNAYASGISEKSYAITLSSGIINRLEDDELEGVIAHELTHIRNRDVRLLMVSIIFVGIFAFISQIALRSVAYGRFGRKDKDNNTAIVLIIFVLALIGMGISTLFQLAISRKREYMADAGAAELTKRPDALARALKKISKDPWIEAVTRDDVAQLFIQHPLKKKDDKGKNFLSSMFATHPPIQNRIEVLEQF